MEFQVRRYKISKILAYGQEEIDNKTSIGILMSKTSISWNTFSHRLKLFEISKSDFESEN